MTDDNPYLNMGAASADNPYMAMVPGAAAPPADQPSMANAPTGFSAMPMNGMVANYVPPSQATTPGQMHALQQGGLTTAGAYLGTMAGAAVPIPGVDAAAAYAGRVVGAGLGDAASQGIDMYRGKQDKFDWGETGGVMTGAAIPGVNLAGAGVAKTAATAAYYGAGGVLSKQVQTAIDEKRPLTLAEMATAFPSGAAGVVAQKLLTPEAGNTPSKAQLDNALKDANRAQAVSDGYVFPAAEQGKGALANNVEQQAGSADLRRGMQGANQGNTNDIAKTDLGLPPNGPITKPAIIAYRQAQYAPYQEVASISANAQAQAEALKAAQLTAGDYHGLNVQAADKTYQAALQKAQTIGGADLDKLQLARSDASDGFDAYRNSGNRAALDDARAAQAKANDLQDKFEAAAKAAGRPDLIAAVKQARTNIAQSHVYEKALNPFTGDINADVVGNTYGDGSALTGGLLKIARANGVMQPYVKDTSAMLPTGQSKITGAGGAVIGGITGGVPGAIAGKVIGSTADGMLSRAATKFVMSPYYQTKIAPPRYGPVTPPMGPLQSVARFAGQNAALNGAPAGVSQYAPDNP